MALAHFPHSRDSIARPQSVEDASCLVCAYELIQAPVIEPRGGLERRYCPDCRQEHLFSATTPVGVHQAVGHSPNNHSASRTPTAAAAALNEAREGQRSV